MGVIASDGIEVAGTAKQKGSKGKGCGGGGWGLTSCVDESEQDVNVSHLELVEVDDGGVSVL